MLAARESEAIPKDYKINRTYAFAHLKRCLPRWLRTALPTAQQFAAVLAELARYLIRFLPDVMKPRPDHPKPHRKHGYKSTC